MLFNGSFGTGLNDPEFRIQLLGVVEPLLYQEPISAASISALRSSSAFLYLENWIRADMPVKWLSAQNKYSFLQIFYLRIAPHDCRAIRYEKERDNHRRQQTIHARHMLTYLGSFS